MIGPARAVFFDVDFTLIYPGPSLQGLMSQHVSPQEQGQLQGANSSLMGITGLIGPTLFTMTFAYFITDRGPLRLPGAPFLLAGFMLFLAMIIASFVARSREADDAEARRA